MHVVNTTVSGRAAVPSDPAIASSRQRPPSPPQPCATREPPVWLSAQSWRSVSPTRRPSACASRASRSARTGSSQSNDVANRSQPRSSSRTWSVASRDACVNHPPEATVSPYCLRWSKQRVREADAACMALPPSRNTANARSRQATDSSRSPSHHHASPRPSSASPTTSISIAAAKASRACAHRACSTHPRRQPAATPRCAPRVDS